MSQDNNNEYVYYYQDPNQAYYQQVQPVQQPLPAETPVAPAAPLKSWVDVTDSRYLKGFVVGAGVALVASNPKVQKAVVSGAVKLWAAVQGGIEEAKEKVQDIKAEVSQD